MTTAPVKARWGALVLVVFTASTIFFVHHFWDMTGDAYEQNQIQALKNLSIMGGAAADRGGRLGPAFGRPAPARGLSGANEKGRPCRPP